MSLNEPRSFRRRVNGVRVPGTDYANGKVYGLICHITDELYIGSTIMTMSDRARNHTNDTNRCISKQIIERGDYEFFIIERFPCHNREELTTREEYHRRNTPCINLIKAVRTDDEKKAYKAQWHKLKYEPSYGTTLQNLFATPEEIDEVETARRNRKNEADRIYRANMNDEQKARDRAAKDKFYEKVKDTDEWKAKRQAINARRKEKPKVVCGCGGSYTDSGCYKKTHEETSKHQKWLN